MKGNKVINFDKVDDLEIEGISDENEAGEEVEDIKNPFDPKDIKISVEPKSLDSLIVRMKQNAIDLNTEFQRKGNLWNAVTQSRLIESLLLKFPLPVFYFDASNDENWLVVDGLQRLWSLKNFVIDGKLVLQGLEILKNYNGETFKSLNLTMQRRINETQITTYLIQQGSPKKVKYYVFRRINTGGLVLNAQEIRHALNQEQAASFIKRISEDSRFKESIKVPDKRMQDREFVLRGLTFISKNYAEYEKPLVTFLDNSMEHFEKSSLEYLNNLEESFFAGLRRSKTYFGKDVFSRSVNKGMKYRLNVALFEVWTSTLAKITDEEFALLVKHRASFMKKYRELVKNKDFEKAIVSSTSDRNAVYTRFSEIQKLINTFINA